MYYIVAKFHAPTYTTFGYMSFFLVVFWDRRNTMHMSPLCMGTGRLKNCLPKIILETFYLFSPKPILNQKCLQGKQKRLLFEHSGLPYYERKGNLGFFVAICPPTSLKYWTLVILAFADILGISGVACDRTELPHTKSHSWNKCPCVVLMQREGRFL